MPVFKTAKVAKPLNLGVAIAQVAARYHKGGFRQAVEVAGLAIGPGRIDPTYYYQAALFRPDLSPAQKRAHVVGLSNDRQNSTLSPFKTGLHGFFNDKLLTGHVLHAAGFPVLQPLAYYSARGGAPAVRSLTSAAAIVGFLKSDGALPCYGKPVDGSLAVGGASFLAISTDGASVQLGDGTEVALTEVAAQIEQYFPKGYLFQPLIRLHADVAAFCGAAVGSLRVVTLWGDGMPEVLYTVIKLPAKGAMMDASVGALNNGYALLDPDTGALIRAQASNQMNDTPLLVAPATGMALTGVVVPFVAQAAELCREAHRLFPTHGILGFDLAVVPDGLIINEINANPFHYVYQRSADRGLRSPDFAPRLDAVAAFMAKSKGRK